MARAVEFAHRAAATPYPVLLLGESGTGKELFARAIHNSSRPAAPFKAVNCGAIPESLAESTLFGAEKGAYTGATTRTFGAFEQAGEGTIFLDEIGELSPAAQARLLRVLEDGKFERVGGKETQRSNARVIAATHRDLRAMADQGLFREDLYYRLAVAVVVLPPLRARGDDLEPVVDALLARINQERGGEPEFQPRALSEPARSVLRGHPWPGNVRELLNTLRRAVLWSAGTVLSVEDVQRALFPDGGAHSTVPVPLPDGFDLQAELDELARVRLQQALAATGGNRTKAAALVGFDNRQRFDAWCDRTGVPLPGRRGR